ncbi:hypothetical protein ThrDRAFT_01314 [Frankia casuarinae]|uniref:ABC-type multidrug transport system ATPase component n=1 Tax=Frankia casuarinae (strain DSM 45818 / CECT 9043 / HFP020203 / CcI3) TaxID=106370 RepID=Q2JGA3_FRACC|nr:ABC-type multidrug transport system ATPase component [Frankia casuarinae]ETA02327.1 hypothetical protein CcI6DRAFT_02317 [Frankia sp. CcI6]EYT92932.1 hypothetical protein ThrDRAFT_01314 [Frankia casuarinae]OAA22240.1 hypothetical protein AAY23_106845 [Frankia casuarinae]ORT98715.1 hypothetical protein UK99_00515 [Frankia casuarinae]
MMTTTGGPGSPSPGATRPGTTRPVPETDRPAAVDVQGLTKRYGRRTVVTGLDLTIPEGVVAGFVGPNGAGKPATEVADCSI